MFQRDILQQLLQWVEDSHRKPLVLRGARQVGKTTVVNELGKQFENYLYLNLENEETARLFEMQITTEELIIDEVTTAAGKSFKLINLPFYLIGMLPHILDEIC